MRVWSIKTVDLVTLLKKITLEDTYSYTIIYILVTSYLSLYYTKKQLDLQSRKLFDAIYIVLNVWRLDCGCFCS